MYQKYGVVFETCGEARGSGMRYYRLCSDAPRFITTSANSFYATHLIVWIRPNMSASRISCCVFTG